MENNEMLNQLLDAVKEQTEVLTAVVQESETRISIKIENEVTKKIDSLFDGYKLAHEKQWELERRFEKLERRLEALEAKAI